MEISVVIPVYGCPEALRPLHERLTETLKKLTRSYEIILVNDGCPKGSWNEIEKICKEDHKVIGVNLLRNFGQIHSTNAGVSMAKGKYVVLMDCDLQDNPSAIADLYSMIKNSADDIVFVKRKNRKTSPLTLFTSKMFYKVYNSFVDGYYDPEVGNYCIVTNKVVYAYNAIKNNNKSFTTTICWMGYKTSYLELENDERFAGKSSYSFRKKLDLAIDMLTSQSNKPLKALIKVGIAIAVFGFVYLLVQIINYIITDYRVDGWMTTIAAIFIMGGIILFSLGGVGIYVGNIFNQTAGVPEYIVSEVLNDKNGK